jgi:hypothetical protein
VTAARDLVAAVPGEALGPEHAELLISWWRWFARPFRNAGPFDFGDEEFLREGIAAFSRLLAKCFVKGRPSSVLAVRSTFGVVFLLHRLRARVDVRKVWARERSAARR